MRLSSRTKLNLIDNYIAIYKILYHCKHILLTETNKETVYKVEHLCDQTLDLKLKYEQAFIVLKMNDIAMDILKSELNSCQNHTISKQSLCSVQELNTSIKIIERDYLKLKI